MTLLKRSIVHRIKTDNIYKSTQNDVCAHLNPTSELAPALNPTQHWTAIADIRQLPSFRPTDTCLHHYTYLLAIDRQTETLLP